jgi:hypothetical protein
MKSKSSDFVWVVVRSSSGIPDLAEVYMDYPSAEKRERGLARTMDEEKEAIAVIQTKLKPARK